MNGEKLKKVHKKHVIFRRRNKYSTKNNDNLICNFVIPQRTTRKENTEDGESFFENGFPIKYFYSFIKRVNSENSSTTHRRILKLIIIEF